MGLNERVRRTACCPILDQSTDTGPGSESNHIAAFVTLGHFWFWSLMTELTTEGFLRRAALFSLGNSFQRRQARCSHIMDFPKPSPSFWFTWSQVTSLT